MRPIAGRRHGMLWAALLVVVCGCGGSGAGGVERVYVVNAGSESLSVIDHATRAVHATIALHARPHGQVPSSDGRWLYVTVSGGHGEVIAIDTATDVVRWRIDVGTSLHQPALTLDDHLLFAPDFARGVVAVVDVGAARLEQEIPLREGDAMLAGAHNAYAGARGRYVYQTAISSGVIARLDVARRAVDRIYHLAGQPRPAALLADESRIYVQLSDLHGFVEVDLESGHELRRVAWPIASGAPPAEPLCHGIGIPPDEAEIWATSRVDDDVRILGLPDLVELARIPLGGDPEWVAFSRDGRTGYVTLTVPGRAEGLVAVVDRRARRVVATVTVGREPSRVHAVVVPAAPVS